MAQPTKKNDHDITSKSGEVATHVNTVKQMNPREGGASQKQNQEEQKDSNSEEEEDEVLGDKEAEEGNVRNFRDSKKENQENTGNQR